MNKRKAFNRLVTMIAVLALTVTSTASFGYDKAPASAASSQGDSSYIVDGGCGGVNRRESHEFLLDGQLQTKWCANAVKKSKPEGEAEKSWWVDFHTVNPVEVSGYRLTPGDDTSKHKGRRPVTWVLKAKKNEDDEWKNIESRTDYRDLHPTDSVSFDVNEPGTYHYFRFVVKDVAEGDCMQLAELKLLYKESDEEDEENDTIVDGGSGGLNDSESHESLPDGTKKTLGIGPIGLPVPSSKNRTAKWAGSFVYYGKYYKDNAANAQPVRYRVLNNETTMYSVDGSTKTMLLDCDNILYHRVFNESGNNIWYDAPVRADINGSGFYDKAFSKLEKSAITSSTKREDRGLWAASEYLNGVALSGEKVFLLSADEAMNPAYGYNDDNFRMKENIQGENGEEWWWLRSPLGNNWAFAGVVDYDGYVYSHGADNAPGGVSPAFNVNLSSVIFTSLISGTAGKAGAEYKLTLKDENLKITGDKEVSISGNKGKLDFDVSVGKGCEGVSQVSVVMLDGKYEAGNPNKASVKYYAKLADISESGSGSAEFTPPEDYNSAWKTYIVAEKCNGKYETDFASAPYEIKLKEENVLVATALAPPNGIIIIAGTAVILIGVVFVLVLRHSKKKITVKTNDTPEE